MNTRSQFSILLGELQSADAYLACQLLVKSTTGFGYTEQPEKSSLRSGILARFKLTN